MLWFVVLCLLLYSSVPASAQFRHGYSSLCIWYPKAAADEISDSEWKNTLAQLFITKGWERGSVLFKEYQNFDDMVQRAEFNCDYNVFIIQGTLVQPHLLNAFLMYALIDWECEDMDISLYYYEQNEEANKWFTLGNNCQTKVCPLSQNTLGIGCTITDNDTFEELIAPNDHIGWIDTPDYVRYKIHMNVGQCKIKNCVRKGMRENVLVIQSGGDDVADLSFSPLDEPKTNRMLRVNWKKWWQVFYTVVDYVNNIIQAMVKRQTPCSG